MLRKPFLFCLQSCAVYADVFGFDNTDFNRNSEVMRWTQSGSGQPEFVLRQGRQDCAD